MLHVTTKMNGKMDMMQSISSGFSEACYKRASDPDSPCHGCYSIKMMKRYKNASICFENNSDILKGRILERHELPTINAAFFRFNAHGEIENKTQVLNFFNICKKNKFTNFALWTHDPKIVHQALKEQKKPKNLRLIYSSQKLNKIDKLPKNFDKVFTVFTKKYAESNQIGINCGHKKCIECLQCYKPNDKNTFINELKK